MKFFGCFDNKHDHLSRNYYYSFCQMFTSLVSLLIRRFSSFWVQLLYFLTLSLVGFLCLKVSKPRAPVAPKDFDIFFMSVSSATASSMSTVEMEVFSNPQLLIITVLMFLGGEVFLSMLELLSSANSMLELQSQIQSSNMSHKHKSIDKKVSSVHGPERNKIEPTNNPDKHNIELGLVVPYQNSNKNTNDLEIGSSTSFPSIEQSEYRILKCLVSVVLGYLLVTHVGGSALVLTYLSVVSSARKILETKRLSNATFSLFMIVSTFASCGFAPTNENMIVFKKNPGLLLILIPQILMGNTMYPLFLRGFIWALQKITKREELGYILKNCKEVGYGHLLPRPHTYLLCATVLGFSLVQFVLFCSMEWNNSQVMEGLNPYEKFVASLFQITNSRHAGESVFDLSMISPAVLVLFVVMMYLPPYTTFMPMKDDPETKSESQKDSRDPPRKTLLECLIFSQLSYLVICIVLLCITEREKMRKDPLNFNVLFISFEVISAYGNVGFSTGYSCKRQINPESSCKDVWYGLAGKWSTQGKFILIIVMFFGRLKKFNMRGGKAWHLA